jgi:hypothetical protein
MWMKTILVAGVLVLSQSVVADGQRTADAQATFERMKRLVGTWSASQQGRSGPEQVTTFKLAGGGRVLVEESGGTLENTFHLDNDRLMLTHYCGSGNQPRMRVREADDRRIAFEMFDITNLASPQSYHTTHLDVEFVSADRIIRTYRGTDGKPQVTQLTRKKG